MAVGDVMGHGAASAVVKDRIENAHTTAMHAEMGPERTLTMLDRCAAAVDGELFATVFHAELDLRLCTLTYASAGHPPALLVSDGEVIHLDAATGTPLGVGLQCGRRPQGTVEIPPGSTLVLYTDGLIERRSSSIVTGLAQLERVVVDHADLGADRLAGAILAGVHPGVVPEDDVALVVVQLARRLQPRAVGLSPSSSSSGAL